MKISLILTTYNEAQDIGHLLESLTLQTRMPDELIIVDALSTDKTVSIIKAYRTQFNFPIRIFKRNHNRSQARNFAIEKANYKIIAVTDAGNILGRNWLYALTQPFKDKGIEAVAGYYIALTPTLFSQAVAPFVAVMPKNFNPRTYLPSSRSVAFTKKAWQKAGGYPPHLEYCEDLIFAKNLKEHTNMVVEKKAVVYWMQKETFGGVFTQIRNYARGDVGAFYRPHVYKIVTVFGRYALFLLLPPIFWIYLIWSIYKINPLVNDKKALVYVPALQLTVDVAIMSGAIQGLLDIHQNKSKPAKPDF